MTRNQYTSLGINSQDVLEWVDSQTSPFTNAQLNAAIRQKKERMEALLALYTSQKLAVKRQQVEAARDRAQRADVQRSIQ